MSNDKKTEAIEPQDYQLGYESDGREYRVCVRRHEVKSGVIAPHQAVDATVFQLRCANFVPASDLHRVTSELEAVTAKLEESERKLQLLLDEQRPSRVYELAEKLKAAEGQVTDWRLWAEDGLGLGEIPRSDSDYRQLLADKFQAAHEAAKPAETMCPEPDCTGAAGHDGLHSFVFLPFDEEDARLAGIKSASPPSPAQAEPKCLHCDSPKHTFGCPNNPSMFKRPDSRAQPPTAPGTTLTVERLCEALRAPIDYSPEVGWVPNGSLHRLADELERAQKGGG